MTQIRHFFGNVFQPIFHLFGWILAFFYGLIPNYAVAIILLTLVVMGVLTPLTIRQTRSMMAMTRLQPEIKKLQQKYKGPENRQLLNEEMMRLYREEGVNPLGGCLPILLQAPFLFILYNVIKGLATTVTKAGKVVSQPRYIPSTSNMYHNIVSSGGKINVWGMDLNLRPFPISAHNGFAGSIPFFIFVILAVFLQYFQMAQMNARSRKAGQAIPSQQQNLQRIMPIFFAYFYLVIPAAVVLYMIVSTAIRILTQDILFRTGVSDPRRQGVATERAMPAAVETAEEAPAPKKATPARPSRRSGGTTKKSSSPPPAPRPKASESRSRSKRKRRTR